MNEPSTARDIAAGVLLQEERRKAWIRDLLPAGRRRLADPRDRALLTELTYGTVRRRATLDAVLAPHSRRSLARLTAPVRIAIRLALYQILFLDRVPVHAAVDHAVSWVKRNGGVGPAGYTNAVLRATAAHVTGLARGPEDPRRDVPREDGSALRLAEPVFADPEVDRAESLAARYSCPLWLVERWLDARGAARAQAILHAGIQRPPLTLRARVERGVLYRSLRDGCPGLRAGPVDTALLVEGHGEGAAFEAVERGDAWVQDATVQRVAPFLRPRRGQRLLDLCAAPGGKTLHLTDLLGGKGEVVACDVDEAKVAVLADLAQHVTGDVVLTTKIVPREGPLPFEPSSFDGILVDAPCTNTGVLRRRVEARWRLVPDDIASLASVQRDLLERSLPLLKPGGRMVYATCSLEPEENRLLVDAFLAAHPEVELVDTFDVPAGRDADGGFAAAMRKLP